MNPIPCPCCRATNETGPNCRRCKADLGLLFAVAERRGFLVSLAKRHAAAGDYAAALQTLAEVAQLQQGPDLRPLQAAVHLAAGNFAAAWAEYQTVTTEPVRRP